MKSQQPQLGLIFFFLLLNSRVCQAQEPAPTRDIVAKHIREYTLLSRLGPGYSREMSPEIIDQFKTLFASDALLYWDLYRIASDSSSFPLTLTEYIDRAKSTYHLKQPILDYPEAKISIELHGKSALVHLEKINQVMTEDDQPLYKTRVHLRLQVSLNQEKPLIESIMRDNRNSFVRSIPVGVNVVTYSNVVHSITSQPVIYLAPNESCETVKMSAGLTVQYGAMVEMKVNKDVQNGLLFSTGVFYSKTPISTSMTGYSKQYPDTLENQAGDHFSCTTYERSASVNEEIEVTRIDVPLLLKSYINKWAYFKAGTSLGFITGNSKISYNLSRTGGGLVTDLSTQQHYYLDQDEELDQAEYGYYRDKYYHFPQDKVVNKMILTIQMAAGFEKQIGDFILGIEPNMTFGMNSLSARSVPGNYQLSDIKEFNSILRSTKMAAFEFTFGFRFLISYLFKD